MADDSFVVFDTSLGNFVVELYSNVAPLTVANFLSYVENPTAGDNYDNGFFHRLVQGFVLQGGGYDVESGTVETIPTGAAVTSEANVSYPNAVGTIAMALSTGPNSATDEFFFNLANNAALNDTSDGGPFTVFGRVVENYSVVQSIAALPTVNAGGAFTNLPVQGTVSSAGVAFSNLVEYSIATVQPITGGQSSQPVLDDASIAPFAAVILSDPGNASGAGDEISITIENASNTATASLGALSLPAAIAASTGVSLSSTGAGDYLLSAATSIANLQTALDALVFIPAALGAGAAPVTAALDIALLSAGGSQGTIDNQDTSLVISHDAALDATVPGLSGAVRTLSFGSTSQAALAAQLFAGVVPANTLYVDSPGAAAMSASQTAAIDDAAGAVTVVGNAAVNETIAAGAGAFAFFAGSGAGTIVAGSGDDLVDLPGGGAWLAALGDGVDTVVATTGNDTIATGSGGSLVFLGSGSNSLASAGADTILGGAGGATVNAAGAPVYFGEGGATLFNALGASATLVGAGAETINAGSANMLVFGGATGGVDFFAGGGSSTVVSYAGGGTLNGGGASTLFFGIGPASYNAGAAVDTVIGYGGGFTATGGANGTLFFTGSAGGNVLSTGAGSSTIIGFGTGDIYKATGGGDDVVEAAGASSTIDGSQSTGANSFFAFASNDVVVGGSGQNAIESAFGNQTLIGGSGSTLFELFDSGPARAVVVENFVAGQDFVQLQGYGGGAGAAALQSATTTGGSETLTLSDGSTVIFQGVTGLGATSFV